MCSFKRTICGILLGTILTFSHASFVNKPPNLAESRAKSLSSSTPQETKSPNSKKRPRIPILHYENDWVCVNKPAGTTVHRSGHTWGRNNNIILSSTLKRQLSRKVFPVHRLDHRTSGAILFAFDSKTCGLLHSSLTSNDAQKEYLALLRGFWDKKDSKVIVNEPLKRKRDGVIQDAISEFTILATFKGSGNQRDVESEGYVPACTLVKCSPKTGRTHQIRRHAYNIGMPIIGDSQHGDSKVNRWWRQNWDLDRLALHCFSLDLPPLGLNEELSGERIKCFAPLPTELLSVLQRDELKDMWQEAIKKDETLMMEHVDIRGGTYGRFYRKKQQIEDKQDERE